MNSHIKVKIESENVQLDIDPPLLHLLKTIGIPPIFRKNFAINVKLFPELLLFEDRKE